jgi:sugar-specific transcriptional regulator TrmB
MGASCLTPRYDTPTILAKLGLKEYEAKVYSALAALGPASATSIFKASGVPRNKIYEALDALSERGFVDAEPGRPTIYRAKSPVEVVEELRRSYSLLCEEAISKLSKLTDLQGEKDLELTWTVRGQSNVRNKVVEMIDGAKRYVYLNHRSTEFLLPLTDSLLAAGKRGVLIKCTISEWSRPLLEKLGDIVEFWRPLPTSMVSGIIENRQTMIALVIVDDRESFTIHAGGAESDNFGIWLGVPALAAMQKRVVDEILRDSERLLLNGPKG